MRLTNLLKISLLALFITSQTAFAFAPSLPAPDRVRLDKDGNTTLMAMAYKGNLTQVCRMGYSEG
ncbi:hypothetical protein ACFL2A_03770 [Thermodesulfobacteriota bacterium]